MKKSFALTLLTALAATMQAFGMATLTAGYSKELPIVPGAWNYNRSACVEYADANHTPMLMFFGSTACTFCDNMISKGLNSTVFNNWIKKEKIVLCFMDVSVNKLTAASILPDKYWCKGVSSDGKTTYPYSNTSSHFPYMRMYWPKSDGTVINQCFSGRDGIMGEGATGSGVAEQITSKLEYFFGNWSAGGGSYKGGVFNEPDDAGNCNEWEAGKAVRTFTLTRTATDVATNKVIVVDASGKEISALTKSLVWASGETTKSVTLDLALCKATANGEEFEIQACDESGTVKSAFTIRYVSGNSPANPLWVGESFGFGEWTCDLDAAKALVKATDGAAYTLVSVQGSMWCPDCGNVERNFLSVTNKAGNAFQAWAKAHNVALVSADIPNYTGTSVTNCATPTLFSTNAYATVLARTAEYPQSGAEAALTNATVRSGYGYLTRKGVTAAEARAMLEKFHALASTDTTEGGFHRPEDLNRNRVGVPAFVLLRKDGSVAARFMRFASASPMLADRAKFDDYLKRFDEMLAIAGSGDHADATEIENNYPGDGAIAFAANGGKASNELCNADFQDVFKLEGVGGNADQNVLVRGSSDATVTIQFWKRNTDGTSATVGASATGKLSDGVSLTQNFAESGDYYLMVKGADITSDAFAADSATASHFHAYEVSGATVLVPQDDAAKANAPAGSNTVVMRLVKDTVYCFSGVSAADNAFFTEVAAADAYKFLKSTVSGDVEVKVSTGPGGEIYYQTWHPGEIAFVASGTNVWESVNDANDDWVEFQVARVGGKSGWVKARVSLDLENSTLEDGRYVFATNAPGNAVDLVWEDGVSSNMTVRVKILDDMFYEGDSSLRFNLEVLASVAGDVTVSSGKGVYEMTVSEDDKSEPGYGLITRTTPEATSKGVAYVREDEGAKIWVERIEAYDGLVMAELASSLSGVTFEMADSRDITNILGRTYVYWSNHERSEKYVLVKGVPAGKKAVIQLKSVDSFKTLSGSNSVTIASVASGAPGFAVSSASFNLSRYVAADEVEVKVDADSLVGGAVTFTKLAGSLPAGLKVAYDADAKAMTFTGATTAKAGDYEVSYQIAETRLGTRVPGLATTVRFTVTDPTDVKTNPEGANPAVATARTFKDIAVIDSESKQLAGLLQLTLPTRGNASGKYVCELGTIALTAKNWSSFDATSKDLSVRLSNAKYGCTADVTVHADGSLKIALDESDDDDTVFEFSVSGEQWSASNTAKDWAGYYTVALPVENVVSSAAEGLAPTGAGYMALTFTSASALKKGTVKWAGMLPNGTTFSGSSTLGAPYEGLSTVGADAKWANLPVFARSTTDCLAVYPRILGNAADIKDSDRRTVTSVEGVVSAWAHGERATDAADYQVHLGSYGGLYDRTEDLDVCCDEYYLSHELGLAFDVGSFVSMAYGKPAAIDPLAVSVSANAITIAAGQENPAAVKLSLNKTTGIVTGSLALTFESKKVTAAYKGVVLTGWGAGCGCGDTPTGLTTLPFVNGSFYLSNVYQYETNRKVTVKQGGYVSVDVLAE